VTSIADATFVVETSGEHDSPPASAVREFLVARGARRVTTIVHPLTAEAAPEHLVETWDPTDGRSRRRRIRLPSRPPLTYPLDLLVPPVPPRADAHIAFNNLVAARALVLGRSRKVAYWAVDFVPDRFGAGSPLTRAYDALDAWVCRSVDMRFEVSEAARAGRDARHGRPTPAQVAPMGAWLDRVPHVPEDNHGARRIVWIGHMVERQGVGCLVEALGLLAERGVEFEVELAGRGPEEDALRASVERLGLQDRVRFLGYVADHVELERILARASVAVAPYDTTVESFTRYADPAKLKAYLAAGLPIVTTDVPPNAHEVAAQGGGEVVEFDPAAIAEALQRALGDERAWVSRRAAALELAGFYDWGRIVERALGSLGFSG
jgi:glycosyltransferase involved in cell wall biosynthesis